jgi:septal ring factor EnvC (AmiA/AmiB activator)
MSDEGRAAVEFLFQQSAKILDELAQGFARRPHGPGGTDAAARDSDQPDSAQNDLRDVRRSIASLRDRFDAVEDRVGLIEKRIATVETRLDDVVQRQSSLEGRTDRMASLLERIAKAQGIAET